MKRALILLVVQLALVLSIAGKYVYERKTRPRIWVRTTQFDPDQPLRGRYLALQLAVDACALPRTEKYFQQYLSPNGSWDWEVVLAAEDGKLMPHLAAERTPAGSTDLSLQTTQPCNRARLRETLDYFIPEHAKSPFPLKPGQELWVEVTVPKEGPPRPIQLALSDPSGFHPLTF
jgi:hypothetical protein